MITSSYYLKPVMAINIAATALLNYPRTKRSCLVPSMKNNFTGLTHFFYSQVFSSA